MQPTDSNASGSQNPELDAYRASRAEEEARRQRLQEFVGDATPDRITEPSDRFAGYYVRTPDGTWQPGENEDSVENRAAFHVRTPDGTWHPGGELQPGGTRGPGDRLGPGENEGLGRYRGQDPDLEFVRRARLLHFQPESSLEDDRTVEQRRDAARAASKERRGPNGDNTKDYELER
jgi:hypothetical protein